MASQSDKVKFDPRVLDKIDRGFYGRLKLTTCQRLRPSRHMAEIKRIKKMSTPIQ